MDSGVEVIALAGRVLFGVLFVVSGLGHLRQSDSMAQYTATRGVPPPLTRSLVLASGVLIIVGAGMVVLGVWGDLGALLLALFLVPTAVVMHGPRKGQDPQQRMMEQTQLLKDLALAGSALLVFVLFGWAGPDLGLTLTEPLFDLK